MDCQSYREAVLESVGAAPPEPEVQAHIDSCDGCRRLAAESLAALELIDTLPDAPVPPGFAPRVLARARSQRRGRRSVWLSAAAAAVIVVTAGLLTLAIRGDGRDRDGVNIASKSDPGTPDTGPEAGVGDAPPDELIENMELIENLELLEKLDAIEAIDAVDAKDTFGALD